MAIADTVNFNQTESTLVLDAFIKVGISPDKQNIADADYQFAVRELNRMLLSWQAYDLHLWLKTEGVLFLQQNQYIYDFTNTSTGDNSTNADDFVETTLTNDVNGGDTTVTLATVTDMTIGDYIGIILDSNLTYWTTITAINTGTLTVTLNAAVPGSGEVASENNYVHTYTNKINRPLRILQGRRYQYNGGNEILIGDENGNTLAREDYFALPNKAQQGTPVSWYYDPQMTTGQLYLWPNSFDSNYAFKFTYMRPICTYDELTDTSDLPQEWQTAIVDGLAYKLCPSYGQSTRYPMLKDLADSSLKMLLAYDTDKSYIKLGVSQY